jgi:hypothetical protein
LLINSLREDKEMSTQPYGAGKCASYATDIRPKFTDEDIDHMKDFGVDLSDYATVRDNADLILTRLKDKELNCTLD